MFLQKYRLYLLPLVSLSFVNLAYSNGLPQTLAQYTIALTDHQRTSTQTYKKITLSINNKAVGHVDYSIFHNQHNLGFIQHLHIEQEERAKGGYGKMLLRHAVDDMLDAQCSSIELHRYPYNLTAADNFSERDKQLKAWYEQFGFVDKFEGTSTMELRDFTKLSSAQVSTRISDKGISFKFMPALVTLKATTPALHA